MLHPKHCPGIAKAATLAILGSPILLCAEPTDSVVVFNEIMYNPASEAGGEPPEWIEVRNQMAVDVDISGWSLGGGVKFSIPEGTIIPAGGYLVFSEDPGAMGIPGVLGPWTGKLDNSGEEVELRNNNQRVMDEVDYGPDDAWPVAADGLGASLAKMAKGLASPPAASWRASRQVGGTPGQENFPAFLPPVVTDLVTANDGWMYRADAVAPAAGWKDAGFGGAGFAQGTAAFQLGADALPAPAVLGTALPAGPPAFYFRRNFAFSGQPASSTLRVRLLADDGAAVYLNGTEIARVNLPSGAGHATPALTPRGAVPAWQELEMPASALAAGQNTIAVEVHQAEALPSYPAAVLASGPVGYWRLGGSSMAAGSVTDLADLPANPAGGAQNGTPQGFAAANLGTAGPRPADTIGGQALLGFEAGNAAPSFQGEGDGGNDVILIPDDGKLNAATTGKLTFEAWVRASGAGQEDGAAIVAKGTGGGGEQFALDLVGGTYRFFHWDGGGAAVVNSSVAPNSTWQHVAAVLDTAAGSMRIYVNGVQTGASSSRPGMLSNTHDLSIGARKNAGSSAYDLNANGKVDEVAIYNRALTGAEIQAHYSAAFVAGATGMDHTDAVFAAEVSTLETIPISATTTLALNEISSTEIEVFNRSGVPVNLTGYSLRTLGAFGLGSVSLPATTLPVNGFLTIPVALTPGNRVALMGADEVLALDAMDVKNSPRARFPDGTGPWLRPSAPTPNGANSIALREEIVINEIMFDHPGPMLLAPGAAQPGQWLELHNKSAAALSLAGWEVSGDVDFLFPAGASIPAGGYVVVAEDPGAFSLGHSIPPANLFGPWSGNLSHSSARLRLIDPAGNPADELTFYSEGRWPLHANAGGSSMELRDARADNSVPESWAASDETGKAGWQTFTWSGMNVPGQAGEPTNWRELNLLLVDGPGECLVDDVSVTDLTVPASLIQNGNFSAGSSKWRFLGNHRKSLVEDEPGNPGNKVLHVRASGPGEYQGNQIETTFALNAALVANHQYQISLKARWLSGGGRLNARLYFNKVAKTNLLSVVGNGGTPGAANSRAIPNAGPVFRDLSHSPVIPSPGQTVTVAVEAADPDNVSSVSLKYQFPAGGWQTAAMTSTDGRRYTGTIAAPSSGVIQFYVQATDGQGAVSTFPALGTESRALIPVQDGQGAGALQTIRLAMTAADATFMHTAVNCLSNELLGCTVIVEGTEIFYDVGVRLKGSFVGRNVPRVGFNLRFHSDQLFRGIHDKLAIDRSQHVAIAQGEIVAKHIAAKAGGIPAMYDDLARFIHPQSGYSSVCQVRTTAFDDIYLDSQFPSGGDGTQFEIEVIRWHTNTVDGNPESPKLVGPNDFANLEVRDWGNDKEAYRWTALQSFGRDRDDYTAMIGLEKMFGLPQGAAFRAEAQLRLDYTAWLRTLAYQWLVQPGDAVYTGGNLHNYRIYIRPHDGKAMFMPWDWDSSFPVSPSSGLVGGSNLAKVVNASADTQRQYRAHLYDLIRTTFNQTYMSRWTQHYGTVAGESMSGILSYINAQANSVLSQLPTGTTFSAMAGAVNANGAVTLTGTGNIQVWFIQINGVDYTPTWTSNTAWTLLVPLAFGANTLAIQALRMDGVAVAGAAAQVQVNNPNQPNWPAIRINEWMADNGGSSVDPADGDAEDWFELFNLTALPVDLSGWKLSDNEGIPGLYTIPQGWIIPANGHLLVWADEEPAQNPVTPTPGSALHAGFKLGASGETILLSAPDGREVDRVTFGQQAADLTEGRYLDGILTAPLTIPTPGTPNVLLRITTIDAGAGTLTVQTTPGWRYQIHASPDMSAWSPIGAPATAVGSELALPLGALPPGRRYYRVTISSP